MSDKKGEEPVVSVLVATYNHGHYIEECLRSLVAQETKFPFEVLVGEDCSTDDTRRRVLELAGEFPEIIRPVLNERNLGVRASNANLRRLARGRYIAICEGDDYWHCPLKLQKQVDVLEADPKVAFVHTDADAYFQASGRRIPSIHQRNGQWDRSYEDVTLALLTRRVNVFTASVCARRELLLKVREENQFEFSTEFPFGDLQTWIELSRLGKVVGIPESFVTYRVLPESASRSRNVEKIINFNEAALRILEHYVDKLKYGEEALRRVRIVFFWPLMELAARRPDRTVRERTHAILATRKTPFLDLTTECGRRIVESPSLFRFGAWIIPLMAKGRRLIARARAWRGRLLTAFN